MNAGCYGSEIKDVFVEATAAIDARPQHASLRPTRWHSAIANPAYRDDLVFVEACCKGRSDDPDDDSRPHERSGRGTRGHAAGKSRTGGSTFKNPTRIGRRKAWQLIDRSRMPRTDDGGGAGIGKALQFSHQYGRRDGLRHRGAGRRGACPRARAKFGVELEWEIKRVGVP